MFRKFKEIYNSQHRYAAVAYLCLILSIILTIPMNPELSRLLRSFALTVPFAMLLFEGPRQYIKDLYVKHDYRFILMGVFAILFVASGVYNGIVYENIGLVLFGQAHEYLGLVSIVALLLIAVLINRNLSFFLSSKATLIILTAAMLYSLLHDHLYILAGFRMTGIMFQSTTMGMFGVICYALALYRIMLARYDSSKAIVWTGALSAILVVLVTQSRIAVFSMIIITGLMVLHLAIKREILPWAYSALILPIVVLALLFARADFFSRFHKESVYNGVEYRFNLYKDSLGNISAKDFLLGTGSITQDSPINNPSLVSDDIAETINDGYLFNSSHNLFIDTLISHGIFVLLAFISLFFVAVKNIFRSKDVIIACFFIVLTINAVFNVPSLELTGLLYVLIFNQALFKK